MTTLAELRLALAEAKHTLRLAKDAHDIDRALAEHAAIAQLNGSAGKNEAERARNLTIALLDNADYCQTVNHLRDCEAAVDRLQAQIAVAEDEIRAAELRARERLADALLGKPLITAIDDAALARCVSFSRAPVAADAANETDDDPPQHHWIQGQTAEDVAWQQHTGTYDIPDTTEWYGR